jgi:glycyl-tRNA synthetase beta subunit
MRRDALGLVTVLLENGIDYSIAAGLQAAARLLPEIKTRQVAKAGKGAPVEAADGRQESLAACLDFVKRRLEMVLRERGLRYDVVQAVLVAQGDNPARCLRAAAALQRWVERADWEATLVAYARCKRIVRPIIDQVRDYRLDPDALDPDSRALWLALCRVTEGMGSDRDVDTVLTALRQLTDAINTFFVRVMVMAEDEAVRRNRLALVYSIAALPDGLLDLSQVMGF